MSRTSKTVINRTIQNPIHAVDVSRRLNRPLVERGRRRRFERRNRVCAMASTRSAMNRFANRSCIVCSCALCNWSIVASSRHRKIHETAETSLYRHFLRATEIAQTARNWPIVKCATIFQMIKYTHMSQMHTQTLASLLCILCEIRHFRVVAVLQSFSANEKNRAGFSHTCTQFIRDNNIIV